MVMVRTPPICSDFEERVVARLNAMVAALPNGTANLYVGADPNSPKSLFPYFRITPTNPRSATIRGHVVEGEGFDYAIGRGTSGEIFVSLNNSARARAREDKFFQICHAVFTSSFTEYLTYSSRGKVIRSRMVLQLDFRSVRLGRHQLFWWLALNRTEKCFHYDPYY
jgi:hypothetical protein